MQEVSAEDAEDVVEIMKHCLMDKVVDETGVITFRKSGASSKQVCTSSCSYRANSLHAIANLAIASGDQQPDYSSC